MKQAGVALLDSSPLLLWLAGRADTQIIKVFKHLAMFQVDDYELLDKFLQGFVSIATTPHILTEVSNHAHHLKGTLGTSLSSSLTRFAEDAREHFTAANELCRYESFTRFGLTDCALAECRDGFTVITADFRLAGYMESRGRDVVNVNHLRQSRLLL